MADFLDQIHFLRPWSFGLFIPLALLYWLGQRASGRQNPWGRYIKPAIMDAILIKRHTRRGINPLGFGMAISIFWILALSGPTWHRIPSSLNEAEKNILIILELDDSMLHSDMYPTRLAHAKLKLKSLLEKLPSSPLGLIVFSGSSHLVLPFTNDQSVLAHYLDGLSPTIMPKNGHDLEGAIEFARGLIDGNETSVILVSDGDYRGSDINKSFQGSSILWLFGGQNYRASVDRQSYQKSGFAVVDSTIDAEDINEIVRELHRGWQAVDLLGEPVWLDSGYYMIWPLLLMMLYWFRPGMVITWD